MVKIDHIGIAVRDLEEALQFYRDQLGLELEKIEVVEEQGVKTAFLPVGESEFELLEATSDDSPIARYLDKYGPGIQHVAIRVKDIRSKLKELEESGVKLVDKEPRKGAGGAKIAFIHPSSTYGVLLEICERQE